MSVGVGSSEGLANFGLDCGNECLNLCLSCCSSEIVPLFPFQQRHVRLAPVLIQQPQALLLGNKCLDFLVQPTLHFVDSINAELTDCFVCVIVIEVLEDVRVVAGLVIGDLVSDLAMNVVVGEVIAAARDKRIAALSVVAGLPDIEIRVCGCLGHYNVNSKLALQALAV